MKCIADWIICLWTLPDNSIAFCTFFFSPVVDGAVSWKLQWPFDPGRPGEHVKQPGRGADLPVLLQSRRAAQMVRATAAGREPLAAPAEEGSGQSEARRAGPVEEGLEPRMLRAETGPHRVHEWTGLLETPRPPQD